MSSRHCLLVAIGVFIPALAMAQSGPMQGACAGDVKALCGSIEPGGGHLRDCMREHRAELSAGCKEALAERRQEHHRSQSSDAPPPATPKGDE